MVPLLIASLGSKEADIGSHNFYGFGHFSNVSCHVLVLPRTARLSVLRENGFRWSEVQEKSVLQSMLNRGNSSCMQSGFWFWVGLLFFFGRRDDLWPKYFGKLYEEQNLQKCLHQIFPKSLRTTRLTDLLKGGDRYRVENALGL